MNNKKNMLAAAIVAALSLTTSNALMAHGSAPNYIKIEESLKSSGAVFVYDKNADEVHIALGDTHACIKVGAMEAEVNGNKIHLDAPIKLEHGSLLVERGFANEIFADHISQTISISHAKHPLDPLSENEILLTQKTVQT